jgi:hypothetical protein
MNMTQLPLNTEHRVMSQLSYHVLYLNYWRTFARQVSGVSWGTSILFTTNFISVLFHYTCNHELIKFYSNYKTQNTTVENGNIVLACRYRDDPKNVYIKSLQGLGMLVISATGKGRGRRARQLALDKCMTPYVKTNQRKRAGGGVAWLKS